MSDKLPQIESDKGFLRLFADWACGVILVYSILFGTGKIIFGAPMQAVVYYGVALVAGIYIYTDLSRRGWSSLR